MLTYRLICCLLALTLLISLPVGPVVAQDEDAPAPAESAPAPASAPEAAPTVPLPPAAFAPPGGPSCPLQDQFKPVSQNGQPFKDQFRPPGAGVSPEHAAFVGAWAGAAPGSDLVFRLVVFRVGAPDTRLAFVGHNFQSQGFWTPSVEEGGVLRFESGFRNANVFRMLEDLNSVELTRQNPDGGFVKATLTRCTLD